MTPEEMANSMIQNMEAKTGHPLNYWLQLASQFGLTKHGQIVKKLKSDHGMTHGFANLVAHKLLKSDAASLGGADDLVNLQYSKGKEHLRSIYEAIAKEVMKFGSDVELAPKKAYVSLRRKKQFGLIQPSTKTRVDVGINIKGKEASGKLENSGSWNSMVSHRVRLNSEDDVDSELISWLKEAYDNA